MLALGTVCYRLGLCLSFFAGESALEMDDG